MKNKTLLCIIAYFVSLIFLSYLNQKLVAEKVQSADNPEVLIKFQSNIVGTISLDTIMTLGEETLQKTLRTSVLSPQDHVYTGVQMKNILNFLDETMLKEGSHMIVKAIDGYVSAFDIKEVEADKNIYLVYKQDGKPL